jgi:hypothetical protein
MRRITRKCPIRNPAGGALGGGTLNGGGATLVDVSAASSSPRCATRTEHISPVEPQKESFNPFSAVTALSPPGLTINNTMPAATRTAPPIKSPSETCDSV